MTTIRLVLTGLLVALTTAFAVTAQDAAPETAPAAGGDVTTLEDILRRQKGLDLDIGEAFRAPPGPHQTPLVPGLQTLGTESDADIWRALKAGEVARPSSDTATGRLMQTLGEDWRKIRLDFILKYTPWILGGVVLLLALFYLVRGRIPIREGRAGTTIPRFSMTHRIAHWFLASTFILMALSGLIILLGRPLLIPLIGKDATSVLASAALQGHNLFGPVFILALLIVIFRFMRGNFIQWADFKWILKGGGLIGGHASSEHYNFGEKTWYWIVVFVGLGMSLTGLLLEFPWVTGDLVWHQLSTILHATGAVLLISIALAHAYIGSIGMEGSLDSMLKGEVDENWAKEHHDLWYEKATGKKVDHDNGRTLAEPAEGTS